MNSQFYLHDEWGFQTQTIAGIDYGTMGKIIIDREYPENCIAACHPGDLADNRYSRSPVNEAMAVASNGPGTPGVLDTGDTITI